MQNINTRKKHIPKKLVIWSAILLALIAYLFASYSFKFFPFAAPEEASISDTIKNEVGNGAAGNKSDNDTTTGLPANSSSTTTDQVPTATDLTVEISSILQDNGFVNATATTSGEGTCVFLYTTADSKPITQQVAASNNTCTSSIREVEFSKLGEWRLRVTYYSNEQKVETTKNVAIQ